VQIMRIGSVLRAFVRHPQPCDLLELASSD
jgi:hypothetical protein